MQTSKLNEKIQIYLITWFCFFSYWEMFNITAYSAVLKLLVASAIPLLCVLMADKISLKTPCLLWFLFVIIYTMQIFIGDIKITTGIAWSLQKAMILFIMIWMMHAQKHTDQIISLFTWCSLIFTLCTVGEYLFPSLIHSLARMLLSSTNYQIVVELNMYQYHSGIATQVSYNACYIAIAMMVFFALLIGKEKEYGKYKFPFILTGLILSVIAMILTGKRGMLLAAILSIVFVVFVVFSIKKGTKKMKAILIGILLACLGTYLFLETDIAENIIRRMQDTDGFLSNRDVLWGILWTGIKAHPIIGNGSASFSLVSDVSGHNSFLQLWYENGLIGLVLVLALMFYGIVFILKQYKRSYHDDTVNYILLFSLLYQVYFIVACLTDSMFYHNTSLLCYLIIYLLPMIALDGRLSDEHTNHTLLVRN